MRRSFVLAFALLAGCPDRSISALVPGQAGATQKNILVGADIDILFVIDNSASTLDKQTVFAENFKNFVAALDAFPTGRPNLHIGVIDTTVDIGNASYAQGNTGCPSPDPNDDGLLQNTARVAGCTPPTGRFISDIKDDTGNRVTNYSGKLEDALSCIAQVGANGCGFEAQLEAMKRALDPKGSVAALNKGFLRDGAYLAIIFLTDEDDASTKDSSVFALPDNSVGGHNDYRVQPLFAYKCDTPISSSAGGNYTNCSPRTDSYLQDPAFYSTFLAGVKDPGQTVVAVIGGPPPGLMTSDNPPQTATSSNIVIGPLMLNGNTQPLALQPSCSATINGNPAIGRPGVRLASFLSAFGDHGKFYSVCQSDYSAALADIGRTLFNAISPCLEGSIDPSDADPNNPGTQVQCAVNEIVNANTATETSTLVPTCPMSDASTPAAQGPRPCWYVVKSTTDCPAPDSGFELKIARDTAPATGTDINVQCAVTSSSM